MVELETILAPISFDGGEPMRFIGMTQVLSDAALLGGTPDRLPAPGRLPARARGRAALRRRFAAASPAGTDPAQPQPSQGAASAPRRVSGPALSGEHRRERNPAPHGATLRGERDGEVARRLYCGLSLSASGIVAAAASWSWRRDFQRLVVQDGPVELLLVLLCAADRGFRISRSSRDRPRRSSRRRACACRSGRAEAWPVSWHHRSKLIVLTS